MLNYYYIFQSLIFSINYLRKILYSVFKPLLYKFNILYIFNYKIIYNRYNLDKLYTNLYLKMVMKKNRFEINLDK